MPSVVSKAAIKTPSPPSRGAWIEITIMRFRKTRPPRSPPSRGAWIEIPPQRTQTHWAESPPSRGAWIEIRQKRRRCHSSQKVAPLAGGVD